MKKFIDDSPCIKNKCISYPVCLNKKRIDCPMIKQYMIDMEKIYRVKSYVHDDNWKPFKLTWDLINKFLPRLQGLC